MVPVIYYSYHNGLESRQTYLYSHSLRRTARAGRHKAYHLHKGTALHYTLGSGVYLKWFARGKRIRLMCSEFAHHRSGYCTCIFVETRLVCVCVCMCVCVCVRERERERKRERKRERERERERKEEIVVLILLKMHTQERSKYYIIT